MEENLIKVEVPENIEYMSQWKEYQLPSGHCVIDKTICGCGFTEYCIRDCNPFDLILCSPRKTLLSNKKNQHDTEDNILYYQSDFLKAEFEGLYKKEDFSSVEEYNRKAADYVFDSVRNHVLNCRTSGKHCVFLVTYDSFHVIAEALKDSISSFRVVVDEFQSIFLDSYFKPQTENEFFSDLKKIPNVIYLSATPMLYKYLMKIQEFRTIPYYKLLWPTERIEMATIREKWTSNLLTEACTVVRTYRDSPFDCSWVPGPDNKPFFSREAVLYMNSVTLICRVIKKMSLKPEEVNVICADEKKNQDKLKKVGHTVGHIPNPKKGETNKMFTFCTRTTYLGSDFYSDNARTFVFSDANVKSLSLDICLDLPQILGRQRLSINPWKNEAVVFYKTFKGTEELTEENFKRHVDKKRRVSKELLSHYSQMGEAKECLEELVRDSVKISSNNPDGIVKNYLGISRDGKVIYNEFLEIADERAWEVSRKENLDQISVRKTISSSIGGNLVHYTDRNQELIEELIQITEGPGRFDSKLRAFCEYMKLHEDNPVLIEQTIYSYRGTKYLCYYTYFGPDVCYSVGYLEAPLKKKLSDLLMEDRLIQCLLLNFKLTEKYSLKYIKETLEKVYKSIGYNAVPKATDLEKYFLLKPVKVLMPDGKYQRGYQILSLIFSENSTQNP